MVSRSYGFTNLYRDTTNSENVNHIEDKFSKLETNAARVIKSIQASVDKNEPIIVLLRKDLYILRKFLFLLHLRGKAINRTYFQDHPLNTRTRDWLGRQKELHNLSSDESLWLHGIQYYLDTPIDQIISDARPRDPGQYSELVAMISNSSHEAESNIDIKHWHAITYEGFHNWYYVNICKASLGSEFVLGHNSFGVWEGKLGDLDGQVHRLYIISPQIAIILKLDATKNQRFGMMIVDSILNDIPFTPPITHYAAPFLAARDFPQLFVNSSPDDTFTFKIHQLTTEQTYKVNEIVLENISKDGTLTFASEHIMLSALVRYDSPPNGSFAKPHRDALRNLKDALSQRIRSGGGSTSTSPSPSRYTPYPTMPIGSSSNQRDSSKEDAPSVATESKKTGFAIATDEEESIPELISSPMTPAPDQSPDSASRPPTSFSFDAESPYSWRSYVPNYPGGETGRVELEEEFLPKSWEDNLFDDVFRDAFASWVQGGRQPNLSLLKQVYLAANRSNKTNHPVSLKIRYMISETIKKRIMTKSDTMYPWFTPSRKLEEILTEYEYNIVFAFGMTMAMEDGLFDFLEESNSSPSLLFVRQLATYTYLHDWLYPQELWRLCERTMNHIPDFNRRHRHLNLELIQPSRYFFFGAGTAIQRIYCAWKFQKIVDRNLMGTLLFSFTDPRQWQERPEIFIAGLVAQFLGFTFVEQLLSKAAWAVVYIVLGSMGIVVVFILIASRRAAAP